MTDDRARVEVDEEWTDEPLLEVEYPDGRVVQYGRLGVVMTDE